MKIKLLTILLTLSSLHSFAETIATARIAELTAHRIDRLVSLGKIDASFNTSTEKIEITTTDTAPAAFKALVTQTRPTQGEPLQLEILFDAAAKPLSYQVIAGGVVGSEPQWVGVNAVTLLEESLHEVLENADNAQFAPFYTNLTSVTLTREQLNENPVARAQVTSKDTAAKLNIYFKLDGSFIFSEIVP